MRSGFGLRDAANCGPVAYTWIAFVSCNLLETWRREFMAAGGGGLAPPSRQEAAHSLFGKRWITSWCYDRWVYWGSWLVVYTSSLKCNNWSLPVLTSWLYMWQFKSLHHQSEPGTHPPKKKPQKLNKHNKNLRGLPVVFLSCVTSKQGNSKFCIPACCRLGFHWADILKTVPSSFSCLFMLWCLEYWPSLGFPEYTWAVYGILQERGVIWFSRQKHKVIHCSFFSFLFLNREERYSHF